MSCYILSDRSTRVLGYSIARLLNCSQRASAQYSVESHACKMSSLPSFLAPCCENGRYDEERVSSLLRALNARAFQSRYPDDPCQEALPPVERVPRTSPLPSQLLALLDNWLYQCAEGDVVEDPLYLALESFAQSLAAMLYRRSSTYSSARESVASL